ncbi:MAG TPA: GNAT family N-acetyltransferase [Caulobacteraceae bacterium]
MSLRAATVADAALLAAMHEMTFEAPWGAAEIAALIDGPGGYALIAGEAEGFILCRAIGGEAEILTLAVNPAARQRGLGRALVEAAAKVALEKNVESFFLEVAEDNAAAIGLYQTTGFRLAGRRPGYYRRADGDTDALVMRRRLNRPL